MHFTAILLLIVGTALAIDVDHDESTLGHNMFLVLQEMDVNTLTVESLQAKVKDFLKTNDHVVSRLLTNALNADIMESEQTKTWEGMVKKEAEDVTIKVGELEAFTKKLQKDSGKTAQEIVREAIEDYFTNVALELKKTVRANHHLEQQA